ncbi:hypothetical protein [Xanthomonas vesicatoria]|uniref:hypothetical protein n=1 Tax=Xanthomonas vesicatoria TaxID=56460 RepID=UPI000A4D8A09|nr:hypothetical protein [Xanthomonas vesicatoria]MCC8558230.1 hypothetical protein [Xanthomonas vesicatoria]MCC8596868.1 hypothetical protein [Xanthomonas vesicatoria]MCC8601824.1 hypothetical protein [Xanthomonas vesicatoria]MCC8605930.1 hypothetical protein [Xanthomonas vesicatoria]MCC8609308.1 hypothetical protein [Xanthomonas vesicatoria]
MDSAAYWPEGFGIPCRMVRIGTVCICMPAALIVCISNIAGYQVYVYCTLMTDEAPLLESDEAATAFT